MLHFSLSNLHAAARHPTGVAIRCLGSSGSCGVGYARGEASLGLRKIDDGTMAIEDVPSTLFKLGI
jgi:hypothetical protein